MKQPKLIGLIGGTAWESTIEYYRILNEMVQEQLGDWNSAPMILYSVNFQEYVELMNAGDWMKISQKMRTIALKLQSAGVEAIMICSNTFHKIADEIQKLIQIPIINVIDAVGERINAKNLHKVGILGTKSTMEGGFYSQKLKEKYQIESIVPDQENRDKINSIIFNELAKGVLNPTSKSILTEIVYDLHQKGAEGIILGCTELPLILNPEDFQIPFFDTLQIHLDKAVKFMLELES